MSFENITAKVGRYYAARIAEFGETARGVDWNSEESQTLRFEQLARLLPLSPFSVIDYGCGYGALVPFLERLGQPFEYQGFDVAGEMVERAAAAHGGNGRRFVASEAELEPADFALASGVFNVKLDTPIEEWTEYTLHGLKVLDGFGRRGFAFNVLTSYSDPDRMRTDLYYADPCRLFDHCKRNFSPRVALLHDYGLYEFTMLVRK